MGGRALVLFPLFALVCALLNHHAAAQGNCCQLTKAKLNGMVGTHAVDDEVCPEVGYFDATSKCSQCPKGTCIVSTASSSYCICPDSFMKRVDWQNNCKESFGKAWPESIGKEDRFRRSCGKESSSSGEAPSGEEEQAAKSSGGGKAASSASSAEDDSIGAPAEDGSIGADAKKSAAESGKTTESAKSTDSKKEEKSTFEENKLSIIFGGVAAFAAVAAVVVAIWQKDQLLLVLKGKREPEEKSVDLDAMA